MLHEPAAKAEKDNASEWKAKLGIKLFLLYSLTYCAFVATAVFATDSLGKPMIGGTNRAIILGMALIIFAVVLGLIYNYMCTKKEDEMNNKEGGSK